MESVHGTSFIIGIAGGSCSGKSTFATALLEELASEQATVDAPALRVERFSTDRYFRSLEEGVPTIVQSNGAIKPDRNHPESADNARLIADVTQRRDADDAPDVILIEGLMTLYLPEVRALLDLRLFVDLPPDLRALRRMMRHLRHLPLEPDLADRMDDAMRYFTECARRGHALYVEPSREYADLVLRGDADLARSASLIGDLVRGRLARREPRASSITASR